MCVSQGHVASATRRVRQPGRVCVSQHGIAGKSIACLADATDDADTQLHISSKRSSNCSLHPTSVLGYLGLGCPCCRCRRTLRWIMRLPCLPLRVPLVTWIPTARSVGASRRSALLIAWPFFGQLLWLTVFSPARGARSASNAVAVPSQASRFSINARMHGPTGDASRVNS
jgi:hypothetical protein